MNIANDQIFVSDKHFDESHGSICLQLYTDVLKKKKFG